MAEVWGANRPCQASTATSGFGGAAGTPGTSSTPWSPTTPSPDSPPGVPTPAGGDRRGTEPALRQRAPTPATPRHPPRPRRHLRVARLPVAERTLRPHAPPPRRPLPRRRRDHPHQPRRLTNQPRQHPTPPPLVQPATGRRTTNTQDNIDDPCHRLRHLVTTTPTRATRGRRGGTTPSPHPQGAPVGIAPFHTQSADLRIRRSVRSVRNVVPGGDGGFVTLDWAA